MPAIDPVKLKRLKIGALLVPFAMKRGLSPAQLSDLVERAMTDSRFDLDAATDEFSNFLIDEDDARFWAEDLEKLGTAPHLFTGAGKDQKRDDEDLRWLHRGRTSGDDTRKPPSHCQSRRV